MSSQIIPLTNHSTPDVAQLQVGEAWQAAEDAVIGHVEREPEGTRQGGNQLLLETAQLLCAMPRKGQV